MLSNDSISMPSLKERAQSISSLSSSESGSLNLSIISSPEDSNINWRDSNNLSNDKFRAQRLEPPSEMRCILESQDSLEPLDCITSVFTDGRSTQDKMEEML